MVGSRLRLPAGSLFALLLLLFALVVGALAALRPAQTAHADCAFPFTPTAYEDLRDRQLFLDTIELAAFDMLFPGDPYFGLPEIEVGPRSDRTMGPATVPPVLLKAIAWIETSVTQADVDVPFGSIGPALVSFDCGYGAAQVTSGMTIPNGENGRGSPEQALVATHFAYNIARGAVVLVDKWNEAPEDRPIAGTDTFGHPAILENWYFALWSYNGFTGPGANRSNHPLDPIFGTWPRSPYSCGPNTDGKGHNRGNYPYQELVYGCVSDPPTIDDQPLWQAQAVTLPDLDDGLWGEPFQLSNFVFPYTNMDIPSPQPFHSDLTAIPDPALREQILGSPELKIVETELRVPYQPSGVSVFGLVNIENTGTGILAWYATSSEPWLTLLPYAGIAVGDDLPCEFEAPCDRVGHLIFSVDSSLMPEGVFTATILVQALGTDQTQVITITVARIIRLGVPGILRN